MKSYCKNIDITDEKFIEAAIWDCLTHRDRKDFGREDIQRIIRRIESCRKKQDRLWWNISTVMLM